MGHLGHGDTRILAKSGFEGLSTMNGNAFIGTTKEQSLRPLLLSPREAAKTLSICERTLYSLTKAGEIPVVRIGRAVRYSLDDLKQWIKRTSEKNM